MSAAPAVIPVTLIGGYLGAGKTTLVNRLLREANGRRVAVLVNEFGALPIDRDLIVSAEGDAIDIAGGCVCCSYGSDLMAALMELPKRRPGVDHVLLETSGVALPGMVANALTLLAGYALNATVVVADAETVRERAVDGYLGDTVARQLASADLILLNKSDLVDAGSLARTAEWLGEASPAARVVETVRCEIPAEAIYGLEARPRASRPLLAPGAPDAERLYETVMVEVCGDAERIGRLVTEAERGPIRAKGFVRGADGVVRSLQVVGRRYETAIAPAGVAAGPLVMIGVRGRFDAAAVAALLADAR